jgi:DNA-binding HxlR family transcriptional regulator
MKNPIHNINKIFESRVRLGIMSALMVNDYMDFNSLKDLLQLSDGNLASHMKALESNNLVEMNKQFVGRKPNTSYRITSLGKSEFESHLLALEDLINNSK